MTDVEFPTLNELLSRAPQFIESIPDIVRNPSANPFQAAILLAAFIVVALIVTVSIVLLILRPTAEEEEYLREGGGLRQETGEAQTGRERRLSWLTAASGVVLMGFAVLLVTGIATSAPETCTSCHTKTTHDAASREDPHSSVTCIACHEGGGVMARATVNSATRAQHALLARADPDRATGYGRPAASDGCLRCHQDDIEGTVVDRERGLRVSHKEPLDAGAECVDCHRLSSGTVTSVTVGMPPCLRCHDGKMTSADCTVCHIGEPTAAIRPVTAAGDMATMLVPNPACGSCHLDMTSCDACHGIRMPHSTAFTAYAHARPAAIEIWSNGRNGPVMCARCHYPGHNDCGNCHTIGPFPSHASPSWREDHTQTFWSNSQVACSCHQWRDWDHDGMNFCEICHPTKPVGVRE